MLLGPGYAEDLRGSSLAAVERTGRLRLIHDLEDYLRMKPGSASTALLVREGVRSSMTCPLVVEGRNVGFLFRSSRKPHSYGEHQVAIHQAVAERLSQAVEKAYRLEELEAANKAYTEMLGFVSHELTAPLASMLMDADVITEGYLGELTEGQREKIRGMTRKAEYLLSLTREYLDLARVEGGQLDMNVRAVDFVADVLAPAIEITRSQFDDAGMGLDAQTPDGAAQVDCDPALMQIVMVNLLGNAAKYGRRNGMSRVTLERQDLLFRGEVWNEGPGFQEEDRSRLFRKFSRLQSPDLRAKKGTGVGLYTCWRILQLHGGKIRAESAPGEWARFTFEIPQPLRRATDPPAATDALGSRE